MVMGADGNLVVIYMEPHVCNHHAWGLGSFRATCGQTRQVVWSSKTSGTFSNGTGRLEF